MKSEKAVKGSGIRYENVFWVFMVGNVAGVIMEGLFCLVHNGAWETHVTTLWGPFNIVYGIGAAAVYCASGCLRNKNIAIKFTAFAFLGAFIEYVFGWFQETVLKSTAWDYSNQPFNIGGRVSLLFTVFWGIIGVLFTYYVMPLLDKVFSKMQGAVWSKLCAVLTVFMLVNNICSLIVFIRWGQRYTTPETSNTLFQLIDKWYPNSYLQQRFCEWKHLAG